MMRLKAIKLRLSGKTFSYLFICTLLQFTGLCNPSICHRLLLGGLLELCLLLEQRLGLIGKRYNRNQRSFEPIIVFFVFSLYTHRSFKANLKMRIMLMLFQSMAAQNDMIEWVRDHR